MADDSDEDYNPHEDQENFNRSTSPMKAAISHPAAKPTKKKAKKETKATQSVRTGGGGTNMKMMDASVAEVKAFVLTLLASHPDVVSPALQRFSPVTCGPLAPSNRSKITKKDLNLKMKSATETEIKAFVLDLLASDSDIISPDFQAFSPCGSASFKPSASDPVLKCCFSCKSKNTTNLVKLHKSSEVKICAGCRHGMLGEHNNLTRDRLLAYFPFTKNEANDIPRRQGGGSFMFYIYKLEDVVQAAISKFGSLYLMAKAKNK